MVRGRKKQRGRPATGAGLGVQVRFQPPLLKALDKFIKEQPGKPSRPEAIRMILADALTAFGLLPVKEESDANGR